MEELKVRWLVSKQPLKLVAFLFEGYELLDAFGPLQMFLSCNAKGLPFALEPVCAEGPVFELITVGEGKTAFAPEVVTNFAVDDEDIPKADILLLPGGNGWESAIKKDSVGRFLESKVAEAALVMSVCNGAGLLATLGMLDGKNATTNKIDFPELQTQFPAVKWKKRARWCVDEKFFTSSGISAGTDLSLFIIEQLLGADVVDRLGRYTEYTRVSDPENDPFFENDQFDWATASAVRGNKIRIGLYLYDNFELFDTFGPLEMFAVANRFQKECFELKVIAKEKVVKSSKGPTFRSNIVGLDPEFYKSVDVLFIPGGIGTIRELYDTASVDWLRKTVNGVEHVFTVCSGSAMVANTGCLDGHKATTNKESYNFLTQYGNTVQWEKSSRYVCDGKFRTSSGVAAGVDLTLAFISHLYGERFADAVAKRAEYIWDPNNVEDPFAEFVPEMTTLEWIKSKVGKVSAGALFSGGLKLGFGMKTSSLLSDM